MGKNCYTHCAVIYTFSPVAPYLGLIIPIIRTSGCRAADLGLIITIIRTKSSAACELFLITAACKPKSKKTFDGGDSGTPNVAFSGHRREHDDSLSSQRAGRPEEQAKGASTERITINTCLVRARYVASFFTTSNFNSPNRPLLGCEPNDCLRTDPKRSDLSADSEGEKCHAYRIQGAVRLDRAEG